MIRATICVFILALSGGGDRLEGRWSGVDSQGTQHVFVFEGQGKVAWTVSNSSGLNTTMAVEYVLDTSVDPHSFDLSGFRDGPLAGKTLFGILEFIDDRTLRFDADAAEVDANAAEARPKEFGERTLTLKRSP